VVKIRVCDPELVDSLLGFLESMGIPVSPSSSETVVTLPEVEDDAFTRLEIEMYLRLWESHGGIRSAELLEAAGAADTAER
jgi:hypothetical protein